ncbi:MAG: hypothetical protein A3J27_06420 [Candidatus Tectomicrobia bacterium RIFCSPLOWO2_12_FULL_69_37]|nr:MAG: hypothetical protein A3J27_06420 [Candidatus Tectomicrobia bacterium RIFCSPLOWO2_12_FULL_69_37]
MGDRGPPLPPEAEIDRKSLAEPPQRVVGLSLPLVDPGDVVEDVRDLRLQRAEHGLRRARPLRLFERFPVRRQNPEHGLECLAQAPFLRMKEGDGVQAGGHAFLVSFLFGELAGGLEPLHGFREVPLPDSELALPVAPLGGRAFRDGGRRRGRLRAAPGEEDGGQRAGRGAPAEAAYFQRCYFEVIMKAPFQFLGGGSTM